MCDFVEGLMDAPNTLSLSLKRLHREHTHIASLSFTWI